MNDASPTDSNPVVEAYKANFDPTQLRRNLRLTPQQRLARLIAHLQVLEELDRARAAGRPKDLEAVAELELLKELDAD